MTTETGHIDVHHHLIPPFYRELLAKAGIDKAGGRALPDWSPQAALELMNLLGTATAVVSVSTPGTGFLADPGEAADLARRLNDFSASLAAGHPGRFGYFATLPMPDTGASAAEAARALDEAHADGVTLLANNRGVYLGQDGQETLWQTLDERGAVAFVHPADLPAPAVEHIPPFAADFLLETTRAAYLLVRNGVVRRYPRIRFVLSHAGGFVPYVSHRIAVSVAADTGRSPLDVLNDLRGFTSTPRSPPAPPPCPLFWPSPAPATSCSAATGPSPPSAAGQYFANGLDTSVDPATLQAINQTSAQVLFPRLAAAPVPPPASPLATRLRLSGQRAAARAFFKLVQPGSSGARVAGRSAGGSATGSRGSRR